MAFKKWLPVLLSVSVVLGLSGCGEETSSSADANTVEESGEAATVDFPTQPITAVVPNSAGGGNDAAARTLSKLMSNLDLVSQPITVQNKPGGGQAVGMAEFATKYNKDPHSLYVGSPPTIINNLRNEGNSPYGYKDVTPLGMIYSDIAILAVKKDSKYKDLKSFVADLKANPEEISIVGGSGPGSQDHLTVMLLADKSGIDPKKVKYIGYDGSGDALTSLLGENGDALTTDLSGITEFVKSGDVRILAVASPERLSGDLADVPTYTEQGVDLVYYNWRGIFGPQDLDPGIVGFWDENLKALTESQEFQDEIAASGFVPGYLDSAEFTTYLEEQEVMFEEILGKLDMLK
ncbi:putative tricarboxylic transport membrane protein [Planomicrobium stackebrandtii]|uniref:Tricarboxylic transport membrane protein n=1 Tax=Planomicrobium stackebrandtii TaxID=253160 RepID=A0ABU0GTY9_9BACL|nr:tripartite tricarboxylate transporter substrate binding protein [Planomicrobium stackebrandtii]MDQ0428816.1 putative tricarboxylic transport membrane protein [Planomicrobium stackebrandtii]